MAWWHKTNPRTQKPFTWETEAGFKSLRETWPVSDTAAQACTAHARPYYHNSSFFSSFIYNDIIERALDCNPNTHHLYSRVYDL